MKNNFLTIGITIVVLLAGVYWYLSSSSGNQQPLTISGATQTAKELQFQSLVSQLRPITFDTSIFSDPKFASLTSIATPITAETLGRLDPFAVIPGVVGK